jgi:hypothetical protein
MVAGTKLRGSKGPIVGKPKKVLKPSDLRTFKGRFAAHLFALMEQHGIDAVRVAKACGLKEPAVRRWLRADGLPALDHLETLGKLFNLPDYRDVLPKR